MYYSVYFQVFEQKYSQEELGNKLQINIISFLWQKYALKKRKNVMESLFPFIVKVCTQKIIYIGKLNLPFL